jgi:hypothetical protein
MNIPKRTGSYAHFAANAGGFIHHDGVGDRVTDKPFGWTDLQAKGCFTLQARYRKDGTFLQVNLYPNI